MEKTAKTEFVISMIIYGTLGVFRKWIPVPSSMLALFRAIIGMLFLVCFVALTGRKISVEAIRKNGKRLLVSGLLLGINWILFFESFNYTTVATGTLCYYMAPLFMIVASVVLYREKISAKKWICIALAILGMILVTGDVFSGFREVRGVVLALGAAVLYCCIVLNNKHLKDISPYDQTIVQLFVSAVSLLPYVLLTADFSAVEFTPLSVVLIIVLGIVHTGIAYALYFGSIVTLPTNFVAIGSYIDPLMAVILSALVLGEKMTPLNILGAALMLGAMTVSEMTD